MFILCIKYHILRLARVLIIILAVVISDFYHMELNNVTTPFVKVLFKIYHNV